MLTDEPIDEDLEALLYAQVYYGKSGDTELIETELTEPNTDKDNQETVPEETVGEGGRRTFQKKKRYFENSLVQQDLEKEKQDTLTQETTTGPPAQNISYAESFIKTTIESSNIAENLEKPFENQTICTPKDQDVASTAAHQLIEISTSPSTNTSQINSSQIITSVPLVNNSISSNPPQLLNNITINQYLYPPNFLERLKASIENKPLSNKCKSDLKKLKNGFISEKEFFNNLKRRLKAQKKQQANIRKAYLKKQNIIAQSEVICLTDSDNSDVEVVEVTNISEESEKTYLTMTGKVEVCLEENKNTCADDDEIIYIAPPPVPVISLDSGSDSETSDEAKEVTQKDDAAKQVAEKETVSQNLPESQLEVDEASNDFLQAQNTSENFNFSLHGSDFHDTEFLRPANPTDIYETESSTSTSDFNRDSSREFSNTVKTIVFSEVDFPKHDIFDESNLESFGEYITPNRGDKEKNKDPKQIPVEISGESKGSKRVNPRTSSESSSESEYEHSNAHPNLPALSPMVCATSSPQKSKKGMRKADEPPKKKKGKVEEETKKKAKEKMSQKNDGILDVEEIGKSADELGKKLKRKSVDAVEDENVPRKKSKKKKNKSGDEKDEISETSSRTPVRTLSPKKSLNENWTVTRSAPSKKTTEDETDTGTVQAETPKRKNKKKKKQSRNEENDIELCDLVALINQRQEELQAIEADSDTRRKDKKKKGKESSVSKSSSDAKTVEVRRDVLENVSEAQENVLEDSGKKKNKKRKRKETSESTITSEVSTNDKHELPEDAEKGVELNTLNTSQEGQGSATEECVRVEETDASQERNSKKKSKRKKRASDKRSSVDEQPDIPTNKNKNAEKEVEKNSDLVEEEIAVVVGDQANSNKNIPVEPQNKEEEDIIIIEEAIPVHTIESSDSEQEDFVTFEDVGIDLELANISSNSADFKEKNDEIVNNREFDVDYVQSKMSDDPEKWKILPSDQYNLNIAKKGPRCNRCRQFGHISLRCPNKPGAPNCNLCGETGHREPRCPNKVCFTCGMAGNYSTVYCYQCVNHRRLACSVCSLKGHKSECCPDLWRRYFLTTAPGPLKQGKKNGLKPRNKMWCSGCASNGHLEYECNTYMWMREYPASSPKVFKYRDVYNTDKEKLQSNKAATSSRIERENLEASDKRQQEKCSNENRTSTQVIQQLNYSPPESLDENRTSTQVIQQLHYSPPESLGGNKTGTQEVQQLNYSPPESLEENRTSAQVIQQLNYNPPASLDIHTQVESNLPNQDGSQSNERPSDPMTLTLDNKGTDESFTKSTDVDPVGTKPGPNITQHIQTESDCPTQDASQSDPVIPTLDNRGTDKNSFGKYSAGESSIKRRDVDPTRSNPGDGSRPNQRRSDPIPTLENRGQRSRGRNRKKSGHNSKLNPLSVMRRPLGFTPYQSVLNPCSLLAAPPISAPRGLFNPVPNDILSHQLANLSNAIASYRHNFSQDGYDYSNQSGPDFYPLQQIPPNPNPLFEDFSDPIIPGGYIDIPNPDNFYRNRDYLDRPSTITRDPMEYRGERRNVRENRYNFRERSTNAREIQRAEENFRDRRNYARDSVSARVELPRSSPKQNQISNTNFISLQPLTRDDVSAYRTQKLNNVDDSTSKKFSDSSRTDLQELINKELDKLKNIRESDGKTYKKKLNSIDHLKKIDVKTNSIKKQMYFLYKQINMFLFGVHRLREGRRNLDYLRRFAFKHNGPVDENKRKELLQAYGYIFGGEHPDFNYRHYLNSMAVTNKR